jgi:hypothetical protein
MARLIAGYPRSGNLMPKAELRACEPVAADIRKMLGFLEFPFLARLSDMTSFNPIGTPLATESIFSFQSISIFILFGQHGAPRASPSYLHLFGEIRRSTLLCSRLRRVILLAFING